MRATPVPLPLLVGTTFGPHRPDISALVKGRNPERSTAQGVRSEEEMEREKETHKHQNNNKR